MVTVTAQVSTRTTAACSVCEWTSERLTRELPVRTAARQHLCATGHPVTLLTNTVTLLEQHQVPDGELELAEHHSVVYTAGSGLSLLRRLVCRQLARKGTLHTRRDIDPYGVLGDGPLPIPQRELPPQ